MAMSGVTLEDNVMSAMNDLRLKKSRFVLLKIGDDGKKIVVSSVGARDVQYKDFAAGLSPNEPCYAAFDFEYESDGVSRDKLILIQWIPDTSKPRAKMLYSASRDALSGVSDGFQPVQANDASELEEEDIIRKIKAHRFA